MKKMLLMCTLVFLFLGLADAIAQSEDSEGRFVFVFGPRVGLTYTGASAENFNAMMQNFFPADREYFPLMSNFGVNFEQRIRLGKSKSHIAFQEVLLVMGLDQNTIIPVLALMLGFRSHIGLEFGLGPNFSLTETPTGVGVSVSVAYAVGWTFTFNDVYIPINIIIDPTSSDGYIRIALLAGFNFNFKSKNNLNTKMEY